MIRGLRRELGHRVDEARARTMVRVARRTFRKQPNRVDRLAIALLGKAVGRDSAPVAPADLDHSG